MNKTDSCCWDEEDFVVKQQKKVERIIRKLDKIGWRIGAKFNKRLGKIAVIFLMTLFVLTTGTYYFLKAFGKGIFKRK